MNRLKLHKEPLFKELLSLPTKNYWVTFMYTTKKNPDKYIYFSFPQFDVEPYFPRVNRFEDGTKLQKGEEAQFEIIEFNKKILKYQENIVLQYAGKDKNEIVSTSSAGCTLLYTIYRIIFSCFYGLFFNLKIIK